MKSEGNVVSLLLALPASREVHPHDAASSYVMTLNCHDWLLQFQVPKLKAARVSPVHHLSRAMAKKRVKKQNKKVCSDETVRFLSSLFVRWADRCLDVWTALL